MEQRTLNTSEYIKILKESPEKKRAYIFIAISLFFSIFLIVFALRPTLITITNINKDIVEKERLQTALDAKITTLSNLDEQYAELKGQIEPLKLIYPVKTNFSLFMANIGAVTSRNGFVLTGLSFEKYKNKGYSLVTKVLIPASVRINVRGKAVNMINLLKDLEGLPMYPVIETVSFSGEKDENNMSSYSITFRIFSVENDKFYD